VPKSHLVKQPSRPAEPVFHAPNAALLIDFDNVTLGIRSDLTKELKTLLSSDIIKGKVNVQRAYADWRRYPQYIVPLSESSIDLIFAPAFGTNKKNATDIRLAIDAIELVFTRPEIGTFILLSGDSDFSAMVIKLKEYGKYVIGVGIRESASDLLIQNCDEYFSYNDLAGLTREADTPSTQRDPWELVGEAVAQMVKNRDVMRSDRLKQVMQQIDPNFDESNAGFNRFSKFVSEAGHKGLIKVSKLENGQYEVAPADGAAAGRPPLAPAAAPGREGERAGARRSRGGRGRGRGDRGPSAAAVAGEVPARGEAAATAPSAPRGPGGLTLAESFDLLRGALAELETPVASEALRLRMSALHGRQDPLLETDRFTRLLRQVHDAEIADVRKLPDGRLEVERRPGSTGAHARISRPVEHAAPIAAPREADEPVPADRPREAVVEITSTEGTGRAGLRFRRGTKTPSAPPVIPLVGIVSIDEEAPAAAEKPARKGRGAPRGGETPVAKKPSRPRARKKAAQATDSDE
jgi:uncharacterized protein (TIGR00288 family)